MRQGKDHMHVIDRQQFLHASVQPSLRGQRLAFWTMTVTTRTPQDSFIATIGAHLSRAPERRGATAFDGPQGGELHTAQAPAGAETVTVVPDEVGQLESTSPPPAVHAGRLAGQRRYGARSSESRGERIVANRPWLR